MNILDMDYPHLYVHVLFTIFLLKTSSASALCFTCAKPGDLSHAQIQRGVREPPPPPLENHKAIGFLGNIVPDPLENHKATKPAVNVGPSSARQRMAFHW